jgi:hypothetical protein
MGERLNSYKLLIGKPEGNGRFGDLVRSWEKVDRVHLAQDRDWKHGC